jgi:tripartite-type tricarboxylate transporter receptor subunit TctC
LVTENPAVTGTLHAAVRAVALSRIEARLYDDAMHSSSGGQPESMSAPSYRIDPDALNALHAAEAPRQCLAYAKRDAAMAIARNLLVVLAPLIALYVPDAARAQDYPTRSVRVVVPFSPGGAVDGPMRLIAQELTRRLGQAVVVENKPGAGATIGTDIVAKAAPDGYTLLLASQTNAISATLYSKLPFDAIEDFVPIALIGREPGVVVVNPALPVTTLQQLIAYVKERPGNVDYASSGNGSGQHLFAALLASRTGMKMNHIPYKGSGQATTDLLSGVVSLSIPGTAGMVGHIKAGKLRPLAVTGARRSPQLPDVPTVMESGVPDFEAYVWMGLLAPKGTPQPIVERLNREVLAVLAEDDVKRYMANAGIEIVGSSPADFGTFFRNEKNLWAKVIRDTGARID